MYLHPPPPPPHTHTHTSHHTLLPLIIPFKKKKKKKTKPNNNTTNQTNRQWVSPLCPCHTSTDLKSSWNRAGHCMRLTTTLGTGTPRSLCCSCNNRTDSQPTIEQITHTHTHIYNPPSTATDVQVVWFHSYNYLLVHCLSVCSLTYVPAPKPFTCFVLSK